MTYAEGPTSGGVGSDHSQRSRGAAGLDVADVAHDEVHGQLKQESRLLPRAVDGTKEAEWIIADYLDVVLHVFTPETRQFYRLEDLWGDVPAVDVEAATA